MIFARPAVMIVAEVELDELPAWNDGPLPLRIGGSVASAEARRAYFNRRAGQALYGPGRVHRFAEPSEGPPGSELELDGLELAGGLLLVVHGTMRADGAGLVDGLRHLVDLGAGSALRSWYESLLDGRGRIGARVRRASALVQVTPAGALAPPLPSPAYDRWTPELQWLWLLSSATPADTYRPAPELCDRLAGSHLRLSDGWQALVLRDGAAFLGSGPDMGPIYRLADDPELHFRTIYLDAFLLGMIQGRRLGEIADDLAALGDPVRHLDRLDALERELAEFRNVYWWQQLGPQWHGNDVLRAYHRQNEIPELLDQVTQQLTESARKALTAASNRTGALLGVLTVVGLPFGLAVGILAALEIPDWRWLLVSLAAATVCTAALLLTNPGRELVRLWRTLGRR
ncbi:MAG: hypothetical protein IT201_09585 [Thermoleophilia bacterium]|nr:hypothetical protein [Thermoleophilia bacterium]